MPAPKTPGFTLTLLGTGTSQGVPVIGCSCEVCTSSDEHDKRLRCSALLQTSNTTVLIDCGPDARQQLLRAGVQRVDAVLLTHEHNDHLIGLDDLRPFIFRQREALQIFAEGRVLDSVRQRFAYAFADNAYPGAPRFELVQIGPNEPLVLGDLPAVLPLRVLHGDLPILGYRVGTALAYLTDVKTLPEATVLDLRDLRHLVLSALHHTGHHSHLNLSESLDLAKRIEASDGTTLIHMSHRMGLHAEVSQVLPEGVQLGFDGLHIGV